MPRIDGRPLHDMKSMKKTVISSHLLPVTTSGGTLGDPVHSESKGKKIKSVLRSPTTSGRRILELYVLVPPELAMWSTAFVRISLNRLTLYLE
jgi:hypothetical protein